jgi:hypothetical protein
LQERSPRVDRTRARARLVAAAAVWALLAAVSAPAAADMPVGEPMSPVEASESPLASWKTPIGEVGYTPGRGLHVGDTGLTLGGYSNVSLFRDEGDPAHLRLDDLSLFVIWEPVTRLRFFSELEYSDVFDIDTKGNVDSPDEALTVERMYVDAGISDALNVRTGIFLTPVGRWNPIHAAPLVWTTSRPITTQLPFDPNVTGVMVFGSWFPRAGTLTYSVFDQFADPIEGNPDFDPADHSLGARLQYDADGGWSVGSSYLAARRGGDWRHLGGLDFLWSRRPLEVMGEGIVRGGEGGGPEWGFYVQPVLAVLPRVALVARYEHYAVPGPAYTDILTFGVAVRLLSTVVGKLEWDAAESHRAAVAEGFRASIAVLF